MAYIGYLFFRAAVFFLSRLPFAVLYVLSDILRVLFYYVTGYRKKVVFDNLRRCFPEKTEAEIAGIAWKFYRNFCDILVENIKIFNLSPDELSRRCRLLNTGTAENLYQNGQSIIAVTGHYCNWEWCAVISRSVKIKIITIYRPLANAHINQYGLQSRMAYGMLFVPNHQTSATFEQYKNQPAVYTFLADQNPGKMSKAIWTTFFNQPTACPVGPEKHAMLHNYPVYYLYLQRVKRGYYTMELIKLTDTPATTQPGEITAAYMHTLENIIKQKPENWLWTHRRWKHQKPPQTPPD
ncbi:hypothetical protein C7N43_03490 [Sphingobacteriales bacterium UPWRP_1]|nr:hypothetical protein BVG80_07895 [Sphingobacteriales bacterium TSM_CSM]PSJ78411.1 hypothetical protein C7N43_03490 [Sphingobacteriales bacterium UPWRP_1]